MAHTGVVPARGKETPQDEYGHQQYNRDQYQPDVQVMVLPFRAFPGRLYIFGAEIRRGGDFHPFRIGRVQKSNIPCVTVQYSITFF